MKLLLPCMCLWPACVADDWNGQPYGGPPTGATDTGVAAAAIVGAWRSEGDDLSQLFSAAPFSYVRVDAVFRADGSYEVASADAAGPLDPLIGTFTADPADGTEPAAVSLTQTTPYAAEAQGIYAIDGDVLTWEVVQTVPDFGFAPPTVATGFGTTSGPGLTPGMNLQRFQRTDP